MYDDNLFRNIQEEIKHPFHNLLLKKYGIRHKFLTNSEYNHAYDVHQASGERGLEQWVNNRKTDLKKRGVIKESLKKKEQEMKERGYEKQGSTTTKDKEGKPVTYTLFRKGQRRKLLRSWKDKEIHENKEKILNYLATAFHNKSYDYYKKNPKSDQKARFLMLANKYSPKYGDVKKQKYVDRFKRHMAEQNINESKVYTNPKEFCLPQGKFSHARYHRHMDEHHRSIERSNNAYEKGNHERAKSHSIIASEHKKIAESYAEDYHQKTGRPIYDPETYGDCKHVVSSKKIAGF